MTERFRPRLCQKQLCRPDCIRSPVHTAACAEFLFCCTVLSAHDQKLFSSPKFSQTKISFRHILSSRSFSKRQSKPYVHRWFTQSQKLSLSRTNRIAASHARQTVYRSYALTIRTDIDPDSYFFCFTKALFGHRDAGCAGNRLGVHLLTAHLMAAGIAERSALDPPEDASNVSRVLLRQSFHFFLSVTGRTGNFTNLQRPKRQGHRKICAPVFLAWGLPQTKYKRVLFALLKRREAVDFFCPLFSLNFWVNCTNLNQSSVCQASDLPQKRFFSAAHPARHSLRHSIPLQEFDLFSKFQNCGVALNCWKNAMTAHSNYFIANSKWFSCLRQRCML